MKPHRPRIRVNQTKWLVILRAKAFGIDSGRYVNQTVVGTDIRVALNVAETLFGKNYIVVGIIREGETQ